MNRERSAQRIVSIEIERLREHPESVNRMSGAAFKKLVGHLEATGQYEPVVVRAYPGRDGEYEILNGCQRVRALRQLGASRADCVVFCADDNRARVYLLTLNTLRGRDDSRLRSKLIAWLCERLGSRTLSKLLTESKTAIEKLTRFSQDTPRPMPAAKPQPPLVPMTFFMTAAEQAVVQEAFDKAAADRGPGQKRLDALLRIARAYTGNRIE